MWDDLLTRLLLVSFKPFNVRLGLKIKIAKSAPTRIAGNCKTFWQLLTYIYKGNSSTHDQVWIPILQNLHIQISKWQIWRELHHHMASNSFQLSDMLQRYHIAPLWTVHLLPWLDHTRTYRLSHQNGTYTRWWSTCVDALWSGFWSDYLEGDLGLASIERIKWKWSKQAYRHLMATLKCAWDEIWKTRSILSIWTRSEHELVVLSRPQDSHK